MESAKAVKRKGRGRKRMTKARKNKRDEEDLFDESDPDSLSGEEGVHIGGQEAWRDVLFLCPAFL